MGQKRSRSKPPLQVLFHVTLDKPNAQAAAAKKRAPKKLKITLKVNPTTRKSTRIVTC
jgi:hypothetical protein